MAAENYVLTLPVTATKYFDNRAQWRLTERSSTSILYSFLSLLTYLYKYKIFLLFESLLVLLRPCDAYPIHHSKCQQENITSLLYSGYSTSVEFRRRKFESEL